VPHFGLSRTYQIITLFAGDTLQHNVTLACSGCTRALAECGGQCRFTARSRPKPAKPSTPSALLHLATHPISDIAYGEKRRVELAVALAQKPRVLLLDEPLAGLSDMERATVKGTHRSDTARDHGDHDRTRHGHRT